MVPGSLWDKEKKELQTIDGLDNGLGLNFSTDFSKSNRSETSGYVFHQQQQKMVGLMYINKLKKHENIMKQGLLTSILILSQAIFPKNSVCQLAK